MKKIRTYVQQSIIFCSLLLFTAVFLASDVSAAAMDFNKTAVVVIGGQTTDPLAVQEAWIKYKAPATGYITLTVQNYQLPLTDQTSSASAAVFAFGEMQLYNSKKNTELSYVKYFNTAGSDSMDTSISYGVKKNTTYYLRMKTTGAASVVCRLTKISENSGSKQSKAKTLKKNKTGRGIIPAGDKTADWYKIEIPKKQTLHIYYSGITDNKLSITFSGEYLKTAKKEITYGDTSLHHTYSTERVQPGIYYVRVQRGNSKTSGYYTLKWK